MVDTRAHKQGFSGNYQILQNNPEKNLALTVVLTCMRRGIAAGDGIIVSSLHSVGQNTTNVQLNDYVDLAGLLLTINDSAHPVNYVSDFISPLRSELWR